MNRKLAKIQIVPPFEKITSNWELITEIESSLNQYLTRTRILQGIPDKDDLSSLGKSGIEQLVIATKQLLHFLQVLRSQHKFVESIKANAAIAQEKLQQHEQILRNHQKKFAERTKAMVEENRVLKEANEKMKRSFAENQQTLRLSLEQTKSELSSLREELSKLENEKKNFLEVINKLQEELAMKDETVNRLQRISGEQQRAKKLQQKMDELLQIKIQRKLKPLYTPKQLEVEGAPLQKVAIQDISAFAKLLSFLTPSQILVLSSTNKRVRLLCNTQLCIRALCGSIIALKNRQIGYYHRHINYFQKMCHKIPEQMLQMAYFRYHILKEPAGQEIMQALNASSLIFEGRFEGQQLYNGLPDYSKQIPNKINFEEAILLEVDNGIVSEFREQRSQERDQLIKLFEQMYTKIKTTYQLYRADEESSSLFISNTLKHISRIFVLAKSLYLQVQNLQQLNSFLLSELNKWDRMEIDKNLQLQDLKAQLQAERKLKLFFTDKSIKSEQKALLEENLKLTYEMKYNKLNDLMNITCSEKDEISKKNEALIKGNERLTSQCKEVRKAYEAIREKYNHVVEELVVVKETIIKMNII